jgi:hypothetical protein
LFIIVLETPDLGVIAIWVNGEEELYGDAASLTG